MARIAIAGFLHETNTFAPIKATWDDFVKAEGFPGLVEGDAMIEALTPINIGSGGFIQEAQALGHEIVPIAWSQAVPSAHVTDEAFENMSRLILDGLDGLARSLPYDAIYLDLHGAMVTESHEDGEGELIRRVREQVGSDIALVVSLDLHANTTERMCDLTDGLIAYRTYPHLDMADTGRRAARYLDRLLNRTAPPPVKARRALPFLMPLTGQCTMIEPMAGVYRYLETLEAQEPALSVLSFTPGFPPADIFDCGPVVSGYGTDQSVVDRAVEKLYDYILEREAQFAVPMLSSDEAVVKAMQSNGPKPIVLADVQDNCGAGATSDTTGLLRALVRHRAQDAAIGILTDPQAAQAAHAAGLGAQIDVSIGGKLFTQGDPPFTGRFKVAGLSDGTFRCTGPFYAGVTAHLGPMAWLMLDGVSVVVASGRMQAADQAMFRHIGLEPNDLKILCLKSAVHFRGDFTEMAEEILIVEAKGAFIDRPERLPYENLRPGIRTCPNGEPHRG